MGGVSVYREYGRSLAPKSFLTAIHCVTVPVVAWLVLAGGLDHVALRWGFHWHSGDLVRRSILFACALVYFARTLLTTFYMLRRKMGWGEVAIISIWVCTIHLSFAIVGGINPRPMWIGGLLGLGLYVAGSLLNTASEFQRKTWKARPENRGRLYTGGLFRYAIHINYFGDQALFTGYALITGSMWAFIVPLLMIAGFLFFNIPELDAYLKKRYGEEFIAYAARTREFVPFLY